MSYWCKSNAYIKIAKSVATVAERVLTLGLERVTQTFKGRKLEKVGAEVDGAVSPARRPQASRRSEC